MSIRRGKSAAGAAAFQPGQELRRGITLMEASAGTGKTYNITTLVLRLVTEVPIPIDKILVVTYTNAATAELKVRIRRRLAQAVEVLRGGEAPQDRELRVLWEKSREGGEQTSRLFLTRLEDAQQCFDMAPISTIHGFCQRALSQNAFESGTDLDLELEPDTGPLLDELVGDYLTRELHAADRTSHAILTGACGLQADDLRSAANAVVADPDMDVLPDLSPEQLQALTPQAWIAAVEVFRSRWADEADDALGPILAGFSRKIKKGEKRPLNGKMYQLKKTGTYRELMEGWLAGDPLPSLESGAWFNYFSARRMLANAMTEEGERQAGHPLFKAWDDLLRLCSMVPTAARVRFTRWVRGALERRSRELNRQTYQDLLRNLAGALDLESSKQAASLHRALRHRFEAALIDEFQDTDALQWQIFSRLFGDEDSFLFLIGDPKQAIYGFRGANIHAYLAARELAREGSVFTMDTNYRSDGGLVQALNHLLDRPGVFGEEPGRIEYVPVKADPRDPDPRLIFPASTPAEARSPLQLRLFDRTLEPGGAPGKLDKGAAWRLVPGQVAADMLELLRQNPRIHDPGSRGADPHGWRALGPEDIAVLVRKNKQAAAIQEALADVGLPSVQAGTGSVLATSEAMAMQSWLDALTQPGRDGAARRAAVSPLFGWTAMDLRRAAADDHGGVGAGAGGAAEQTGQWEAWLTTLQAWRKRLDSQGFISTFRHMLEGYAPAGRPTVYQRMLQLPGGERRLTNILHLAELLHHAERERHLHPAGLSLWLRRQRAPGQGDPGSAAEMRLETDDAAVRIVTMHRSKGLEFPVVFAPYLWDGQLLGHRDLAYLKVPDPADPTVRLLDLHSDTRSPPKSTHITRAEREAQRENLRLLYVTLTRARLRCVFYWGAVKDNERSPLAAVLHGEEAGQSHGEGADRLAIANTRVKKMDADQLLADLSRQFENAGPRLTVERCRHRAVTAWDPPLENPEELSCRDFGRRQVDRLWGQSSYSDLTRNIGHSGLETSAPPGDGLADEAPGAQGDPATQGRDTDQDAELTPEPTAASSLVPAAVAASGEPVPLADFPTGADAGTCLHEVFEELDFTRLSSDRPEPPDEGHLKTRLEQSLTAHGFSHEHFLSILQDGIPPVLHTPLGGPLGQTRLCDISPRDRLNEMHFDIPLAGGYDWSQGGAGKVVHAAQLAQAMNLRGGHHPDDDTVPRPYLDGLQSALGEQKLAGFLTGFIDLVWRAGDRWFVADYKSNRMNRHRPRVIHQQLFDHEGMVYEMGAHHYFLQYHLYTVALHRFLGQRLGSDYTYADHFGGAYYLFIRGMVGQETPWVEGSGGHRRYHGVFFDRPAEDVVVALDQLFREPPPMDAEGDES